MFLPVLAEKSVKSLQFLALFAPQHRRVQTFYNRLQGCANASRRAALLPVNELNSEIADKFTSENMSP